MNVSTSVERGCPYPCATVAAAYIWPEEGIIQFYHGGQAEGDHRYGSVRPTAAWSSSPDLHGRGFHPNSRAGGVP